MPIFTPPIQLSVPPTLPDDTSSLSYRLFRHFRSRPEGINIYIYSDGSVSENDPDGYSTLWAESNRTSDTLPGAPHVTKVIWGGHESVEVTDDEANLLIAAGYSVDYAPYQGEDIAWYGELNSFGNVASHHTTTQGGTFTTYARHSNWSNDQAYFFSLQMSDGTIILPGQPCSYSAFRPTGTSLQFARWTPPDGDFDMELIPTDTGALHPLSTTLGGGGKVGGADFEDMCIYRVGGVGEERALLSVGRNYNDWWIGTAPAGVPGNNGVYPCHVVLTKQAGVWTYNEAESRYPADYLAQNPTAAANIYLATTSPTTLEPLTAVRQCVELDVFPQSGHIIQAHYDDRSGIGFNSGALSVVGDDGGGLQLKAGFLIPNIDWPTGHRIQGRARSPKVNPTSPINDERFILEYDIFDNSTPAHTSGALLNGTANAVITTPNSPAWAVSGVMRGAMRILAQDYTPAAGNVYLMAFHEPTGNQRSWTLLLNGSGTLQFITSADGTNVVVSQFSAAPGFVNGVGYWVGWEYDTVVGTLKFYKCADQEAMPTFWTDWTQIGSDIAASPTALFNANCRLTLGGSSNFFSNRYTGWIRVARLYDDGVLIADANFAPNGSPRAVDGATTYTDSLGHVWTLQSSTGVRIHRVGKFVAQEFSYNAGAGTIRAVSQAFWPADGQMNPEQARFDSEGNLYLSQVWNGLYNGPIAIYEADGSGGHAYDAWPVTGAWLTGDGSLTTEWGKFVTSTDSLGDSIGSTSSGPIWDAADEVLYWMTGTSGLLAIQRTGSGHPYTWEYKGVTTIYSYELTRVHPMRPIIDEAQDMIWVVVGRGFSGAYPPVSLNSQQYTVGIKRRFWET